MKICPACWGVLWRRDEPTAEQAAAAAAQRLQMRYERDRKRQEQREKLKEKREERRAAWSPPDNTPEKDNDGK